MKKMNRVPVIVWNPAYIEELEPRDSMDLISGDSQIITAPASDDGATGEEVADEPDVGDVVEEVVDGPDVGGSAEGAEVDVKQVLQDAVQSLSTLNDEIRSVLSLSRDRRAVVPDIDTYDTGKDTEEEFRLYPNPTRKELKDRLNNQVWDLLHLLHERVVQGTYDETDVKLIEGLQVIWVLQARLTIYAEIAIKHAKRPYYNQGI